MRVWMPPRLVIVLAALPIALALPSRAGAQLVSFSAASADVKHELLGEPLIGAAGRVSVPLQPRFWATVGAEYVTGRARRLGTLCAGLADPAQCPDEPLRDDARLTTVSGAVDVGVLSW